MSIVDEETGRYDYGSPVYVTFLLSDGMGCTVPVQIIEHYDSGEVVGYLVHPSIGDIEILRIEDQRLMGWFVSGFDAASETMSKPLTEQIEKIFAPTRTQKSSAPVLNFPNFKKSKEEQDERPSDD